MSVVETIVDMPAKYSSAVFGQLDVLAEKVGRAIRM